MRRPVISQLQLGDHVTGHVPSPARRLAPVEAVAVLITKHLARRYRHTVRVGAPVHIADDNSSSRELLTLSEFRELMIMV